MKLTISIFLFVCLFILSCNDKGPELCGPLNFHLLNLGTDGVKEDLNGWLESEQPEPNDDDTIGHKANLLAFVQRLNDHCNLNASISCYACVKTLPVQSEVLVNVVYAGDTFLRVIDISTPASNVMSIINVHEQ